MVVQLCDGAIGTTRLATANARAAIDASQKLDFAVELEPATARNSGHLKVAGVVPLSEVPALADCASPRIHTLSSLDCLCSCALGGLLTPVGCAVALGVMPPAVPALTCERPCVCAAQLGAGGPGKDELKVEVDVKDSGMMIVTTVAPEMQWIGGAAHLQLTCAPRHLLPASTRCRMCASCWARQLRSRQADCTRTRQLTAWWACDTLPLLDAGPLGTWRPPSSAASWRCPRAASPAPRCCGTPSPASPPRHVTLLAYSHGVDMC